MYVTLGNTTFLALLCHKRYCLRYGKNQKGEGGLKPPYLTLPRKIYFTSLQKLKIWQEKVVVMEWVLA